MPSLDGFVINKRENVKGLPYKKEKRPTPSIPLRGGGKEDKKPAYEKIKTPGSTLKERAPGLAPEAGLRKDPDNDGRVEDLSDNCGY